MDQEVRTRRPNEHQGYGRNKTEIINIFRIIKNNQNEK